MFLACTETDSCLPVSTVSTSGSDRRASATSVASGIGICMQSLHVKVFNRNQNEFPESGHFFVNKCAHCIKKML